MTGKSVIIGFSLALIAVAAEVLAGLGNRWGVWDYRTALLILRWAAYGGGVAGVISLVGSVLHWRGAQHRSLVLSLISLLIALAAAGIPWSFSQVAKRVPAIHDISTDTENPPHFAAILPLRQSAPNRADYGGPEVAAKQRAAYGDIKPLEPSLSPDRAFDKALDAARSLGWQIADANKPEGRIEATDKTFWFGFKDDIVIRVAATARGSRIDVRSVSRVGKNDFGTNAKRIRRFLNKLQTMD